MKAVSYTHLDVYKRQGLEHMDERYIKAVGYATKAARQQRPKMVLIADIASDDENAVGEAASHIVRLCNARDGEGFIAVSAEARKKFWLDRARTAAIAKHTNAFKINEDVVIPLPRLGDYSDGIERINIELSIKNKLKLLDSLEVFMLGDLPLQADEEGNADAEMVKTKQAMALQLIAKLRENWSLILNNLDAPVGILGDAAAKLTQYENIFRAVQSYDLRISWTVSYTHLDVYKRQPLQLHLVFRPRNCYSVLRWRDLGYFKCITWRA